MPSPLKVSVYMVNGERERYSRWHARGNGGWALPRPKREMDDSASKIAKHGKITYSRSFSNTSVRLPTNLRGMNMPYRINVTAPRILLSSEWLVYCVSVK